MALKGTIRDFGVADIFQLIGQQAKTGVLVLRNDVDEVRVFFREGSVVRAESATRPGQMLLGSFLVRAEIIGDEQLERALAEQRRTLKRLGTVLTDLGLVKHEVIAEFASLQMTETIYGLFLWKNGTYEFESVPVEASPEGVEPLRAENIVMNGIRMVDEWPSIRARIPSYGWLVEAQKPLPPPKKDKNDEFNLSAFDEGGSASADLDDIGAYERLIYGLIAPGRDIQKIIDLARLGEFEACRALAGLLAHGYVRLSHPAPAAVPETSDVPVVTPAQRVAQAAMALGRILVSASLVALGAMLVARISPTQIGLDPGGALAFEAKPLQGHFADSQLRVIRRALEVYRFETGRYPDTLETLVDTGMLTERDLRFPFHRSYYYRLEGESVVLLPPVH